MNKTSGINNNADIHVYTETQKNLNNYVINIFVKFAL